MEEYSLQVHNFAKTSQRGFMVFGHQRSPSMEFKELTKKDAQIQLAQELQKLLVTCPNSYKDVIQKDFEGYEKLFGRFINETGPSVEWEKIQKLPEGAVWNFSELRAPDTELVKNMLNKLVVVKLNGGLGTSMGCQGPKSIIPVRSELTFLDLTVQQIEHLNKTYSTNVPLVLMNSFNTDDDTQKVIRKYHGFQVKTYTFNQSRYPRINKESLMPIAKTTGSDADLEA
nr:UTP--glucose-1-phosphate uridylyltransferase-like [Cherax quadricarinatus]